MPSASARRRAGRIGVSALAAVGVIAGLAACGGSDDGGSTAAATSGTGTSAVAAEGGDYTYVYTNIPTFASIYCGMKIEAERLGVTMHDAQAVEFTVAAQTPVINAAIASKPSALLISPADANASAAPLLKAKAAGVPVVAASTTVNDKDVLSAEVLVDDAAAGRLAADTLARLADGKSGNVGMIALKPGAAKNADTRREAFTEQLKEYPNLKLAQPQYYNTIDPSAVAAAANAVLSRSPDLLGFVGTSGVATTGVATAIKQRHRTDVIGVGWEDGAPAANNALRDGTIKALVNYDNRKIGATALDVAVGIAGDEDVEKVTVIQPDVLTSDSPADPSLEQCPV